MPQVAAQGGWELNGGTWNSRSSSWVAGVVARFNLFHGLADRARLAEARAQVTGRAHEKEKAETMARLDVPIAIARLETARASEAIGRAAADRARESRRIIRVRPRALSLWTSPEVSRQPRTNRTGLRYFVERLRDPSSAVTPREAQSPDRLSTLEGPVRNRHIQQPESG